MLKVVGASGFQTQVSCWILIGFIILGILFLYFGSIPTPEDDGNYSATVFWFPSTKRFDIQFWGQNNQPDEIRQAAARAYYQPDMSKTGWAILEIETDASYPDYVQAFASGMLEGCLSWLHIYWHWKNMIERTCINRQQFCRYVREFVQNNTDSIRIKAIELDDVDPFWHQVNLFYIQLDGLEYGWNFEVGRNFEDFEIPSQDFIWMNMMSDLKDFEILLNASRNYNPARPAVAMALLKLISRNGSDDHFMLAHATSAMYSSMLRIQKKYNFAYHKTGDDQSEPVPGQNIRFTSYPGSIHSQDDFYQISLINGYHSTISGTTIHNYNHTNWHLVNSHTQILVGVRVMAGNRLATDGKSWSKIVSRRNSGTGNKQWLHIMQYPMSNTNNITLWVMEQMPGKTKYADQTEVMIKRGYWISSGIPHYLEIKNSTQNEEVANVRYSFWYYHMPVLKVLKLGHVNVSDVDSLLNLMRSPDLSLVGRSDIYEDIIAELHYNASSSNATAYETSVLPTLSSSQNGTSAIMYRNSNPAGHKYPVQNVDNETNRRRIPEGGTIKNRNSNKYMNVEYKSLNRFFQNYITPLKKLFKLNTVVSLYDPFIMRNVSANKIPTYYYHVEPGSTNNDNNYYRYNIGGISGNFELKDFDGVTDLKIIENTHVLNFHAVAGPPFTGKKSKKTVAPFQWSKSRINHLPHHGHSDIWNYTPVITKWVWN